jgi:hypothetical protein
MYDRTSQKHMGDVQRALPHCKEFEHAKIPFVPV